METASLINSSSSFHPPKSLGELIKMSCPGQTSRAMTSEFLGTGHRNSIFNVPSKSNAVKAHQHPLTELLVKKCVHHTYPYFPVLLLSIPSCHFENDHLNQLSTCEACPSSNPSINAIFILQQFVWIINAK